MVAFLVNMGLLALLVTALIFVSSRNWHFQGLLMLSICIITLRAVFIYGAAWFGISW